METFALRDLTFTYPGQQEPSLDGVSLAVAQGQFVTLCGRSGCGKTTLLRQLKPALTPHGRRTGTILFEGAPLAELDGRAQSTRIGFVLQSPENQIVTDKVWHELAFGLESLGYPTSAIRLRVAEMASFFGIQNWFYRNVSELSGGQKQLLNLASVMALGPSVLLLDEPTSQLDPIAAADFLAAVGKLNRELGVTVLLSEHRLEEALPLSDRLVVLEGGKMIADGEPRTAGQALRATGDAMFRAMPTPMRVWAGLPSDLSCPATVREGRAFLASYAALHPLSPVPDRLPRPAGDGPAAVELQDLRFRYEKDGPDVVKGLDLSIPTGSLFAIVGGNGTGKSTALSLIAGLNTPYRGQVRLFGQKLRDIPLAELRGRLLGLLPQNPQTLFVGKTVDRDLRELLAERKLQKPEREALLQRVVSLCELEPLLERHPHDLSGGEQQRAALAKVLLLEPEILLLDEATKGLDRTFQEKLAGILRALTAQGVTVVLVSHDVEFCAQYADHCALFFDGSVVSQGPPQSFFSGNSFYTTAANRMARDLLPGAVTAEEVLTACGGEALPPQAPPPQPSPKRARKAADPGAAQQSIPDQVPTGQRRLPKRTVAAAISILLLIPLTLFVGTYYMGNRKYLFISLLVVLETMIPFFLLFEGRKPRARELVILATLCAIAVAGRAAFFFAPQFKPVAALVIITAVAFGGESGFLVGAVSMLCSNIFFGQGPWTPFQMFAMGIIGFLAGVLFRKGLLRRNLIALCLYGFCSVFFVYGFLMNTCTVFLTQQHITWGMILASCAVGVPMDLIHAGSTVLFLAVAAKPLLEKLDRIKVKYGLVEDPSEAA